MRRFLIVATTLLLGALTVQSQQKGFTVRGTLPLPDGYNVGLCCHTDTAMSVMIAEGWMKDGQFTLSGQIDKPYQGTLMTNNLQLVQQHQWPDDSIRWTYTEVFVSPGDLRFAPVNGHTEPFALTGTAVQTDYNRLQQMGGEQGDSLWSFIDRHPRSVISTWLACRLTDRAYNLTAQQVVHLQQRVKGSEADPQRFALLQQKLGMAAKTVKDAPVTDLELTDTAGTVCHLTDIVSRHAGRYLLLDFWASWCGICIHSMPDIAALAADYATAFSVVGISIDTRRPAWLKALGKHPVPWPQYCTTQQGYRDLFSKYQVGNGVPYYLLVSPQGRVIGSPESPAEVRTLLQSLIPKQ